MTRWPIVLASGSPRRFELLKRITEQFETIVPNVSEDGDDTDPESYALEIAKRKADSVAKAHPDKLILAADTIVVLDGEVLGKPTCDSKAIEMLTRLSGKTHRVITAVALCWPGGSAAFTESSRVTFREATLREIEAYVATGEPLDKAGSYGIQGMGGTLVTRVEGDYDNVVGLPVARVRETLEAHQLI